MIHDSFPFLRNKSQFLINILFLHLSPQRMRKWKLEETLQSVEVFREPNYKLEQYPTSAHLASCILQTATNNGDIEGKIVADIGCGTSILSIGAALMGSAYFF